MSELMAVAPVLLVTGFLGAGKTALLNNLLSQPHGRRLAAVVNDFGAINIDAELLKNVTEDVISLKNGCICCSLQGDLLQTLSTILRRDPAPDGIVIETSGVSDPAEIVRSLLDPVIWKQAPLDAVICVVDARALIDDPLLADDALWQSQLRVADYVAVSKTDLLSDAESARAFVILRRHKGGDHFYPMLNGHLPHELLFSANLHAPADASRQPFSALPVLPEFDSVEWISDAALDATPFQRLMGELGGMIVRAKGIVSFSGRQTEPMLFQLVGTRATIGRAPSGVLVQNATQLVFIARKGRLDEAWLKTRLDACLVTMQL